MLQTHRSTSTMYSMWCFVVRSAQGARILNPLMLLATPRMRTSAGADFPLKLSTSSSTKQSLCYNFNQTLLLYPLHSQLPYHPHTQEQSSLSSAHMSRAPITFWRQLRACTLVAAFRMKVISANGHLGSSPLQRRCLNMWCLCFKRTSIFVLRLLINRRLRP